MKTSRLVCGIVAVVLGLGMFWGSLSILGDERDADDFFVSSEHEVDRASVALASEEVNVLKDAPG